MADDTYRFKIDLEGDCGIAFNQHYIKSIDSDYLRWQIMALELTNVSEISIFNEDKRRPSDLIQTISEYESIKRVNLFMKTGHRFKNIQRVELDELNIVCIQNRTYKYAFDIFRNVGMRVLRLRNVMLNYEAMIDIMFSKNIEQIYLTDISVESFNKNRFLSLINSFEVVCLRMTNKHTLRGRSNISEALTIRRNFCEYTIDFLNSLNSTNNKIRVLVVQLIRLGEFNFEKLRNVEQLEHLCIILDDNNNAASVVDMVLQCQNLEKKLTIINITPNNKPREARLRERDCFLEHHARNLTFQYFTCKLDQLF